MSPVQAPDTKGLLPRIPGTCKTAGWFSLSNTINRNVFSFLFDVVFFPLSGTNRIPREVSCSPLPGGVGGVPVHVRQPPEGRPHLPRHRPAQAPLVGPQVTCQDLKKTSKKVEKGDIKLT